MKVLHIVSFLLVEVGALNWGLVGLFQFNLVTTLFGSMPAVESVVYVLVGAAAVVLALTHKRDCKACA